MVDVLFLSNESLADKDGKRSDSRGLENVKAALLQSKGIKSFEKEKN